MMREALVKNTLINKKLPWRRRLRGSKAPNKLTDHSQICCKKQLQNLFSSREKRKGKKFKEKKKEMN